MSKPKFAAIKLETPSTSENSGLILAHNPVFLQARASFGESLLRAVVREQSFDEFMRESLLAMMSLVRWEAGSILEFDHLKEIYFFRSVTGKSSHHLPSFEIPRGQGIVGRVGEERRTLVIKDFASDQGHLNAIAQAVGFDVRCLVAMPLTIGGKLFGVLELLNPDASVVVDEPVVNHLEGLAGLLVLAIEARMKIAWRKA